MKLNPNWFIISDLHFGHHGLLKFGVRPVGYEEIIIQNWNKTISNKDYVLMLGDLSLTNKDKTLEYCRRLNGYKYMLLGNHDNKSSSWYADCGFTVVEPIFKTFYVNDQKQLRVFFTHEPVIPLPNFVKKNKKEFHYFNIHGHMHGNTHHDIPVADHHRDVSAECISLTPVKLSEIIASFTKIAQ
jgi:calcineurin-like phosphoesterase family protein